MDSVHIYCDYFFIFYILLIFPDLSGFDQIQNHNLTVSRNPIHFLFFTERDRSTIVRKIIFYSFLYSLRLYFSLFYPRDKIPYSIIIDLYHDNPNIINKITILQFQKFGYFFIYFQREQVDISRVDLQLSHHFI